MRHDNGQVIYGSLKGFLKKAGGNYAEDSSLRCEFHCAGSNMKPSGFWYPEVTCIGFIVHQRGKSALLAGKRVWEIR